MRLILAPILAGALLASPVAAQESEPESLMDILARAAALNAEEQRSGLIAFLENQISSPDRQIRLSNVEGALSSDASIGQITISDTEGIWLVIQNAAINWNQGALIFGRLEINSLSADSIAYIRNPISTEPPAGPSPEAGGFSVPEFPVAVILQNLSVPRVSFGEQVFGLGSLISIDGAMTLEGGAIDADLDIARLDGPGGTLTLDLAYANATREIDLSLELVEPENGIVANLLNIEGRPEIALGLSGAGPIEDLAVSLTLDAANSRVLSGTGTLNQTADGLSIAADLGGPIADILPVAYRDFFGSETALSLDALMREEGGFTLSDFRLTGGQLSLFANATTTADGFLNRLDLSGEIGATDGRPVILPVPGAATTIERAKFDIDFGANGSENWTGDLEVLNFAMPDFAARSLTLKGFGVAAALEDPDNRRITINGDGLLAGISAASPDVRAALGPAIGLGLAALWRSGEPLAVAQFRLSGATFSLDMAGEVAEGQFDGDMVLATDNIAHFSGFAGRPVSGALNLRAAGTLSPLTGGFDLTLLGNGSRLTINDEIADRLLEGPARLTGRVARNENGLEMENFRLSNNAIILTADGTYATGAADFAFDLALADLALISEEMSGQVTVSGTARGAEERIALALGISAPQGTLSSRPLRDATLRFDGLSAGAALTGTLSGSAFLDGHRIGLGAGIDSNPDRLHLSDINFTAPGAQLTGALTQLANGLVDGRVRLAAPNIETAAALFLAQARGAAHADIVLSSAGGTQGADVSADIENVTVNDIVIRSADIEASIADLFGVPVVEGTINGRGIAAAGVNVETLALTATSSEQTTRFSGSAALAGNTNIALAGSLAPIAEGFRVALDRLDLTQNQLSARLAAPTALTVAGETVSFSGVEIAVGSGRITATGSAGEALDIALRLDALPLSIANTVVPGLGLAGTLSGTAQVAGTAANPRATFSAEGSGLNATAISEFGIAPLSLAAQGTFADNRVTLTSARATGAQGLSATAQGTIPLDGAGLDVSVNGSIPLVLANRFVADRGGQLSGTATLDARLSGRLDNPQFSGTVSVAGAEYIDPELALRLQAITGNATLSGDRITINTLSGQLATGGTVTASGTFGLDAPAFTSDLRFTLNNARYADGNLLVATLNGSLALTGPVGRGGLLSGNIAIARADITVPEAIGGGGALIDVDHRNPPPAVSQTLARARVDERASSAGGSGPALGLDVTISAPNQVFIRGRGLDAEAGGALRITGTVNDIAPVGALNLIRGRLSILGQRIDFESGSVTLIGDLDPFIDFVARTSGEGITVFVTVTGRASAPEINFSSEPMLPQDEVLARLIFNRGVGELTPLQLAQLAAAAAELAGAGGNTSLMDGLRQAAGLDDLDIITDDEGNAAVRAGRYIDDNIYLGVEAGAGGQSRVTIDLDITDSLTARGATGTDGNSSIGIFYEQDY